MRVRGIARQPSRRGGRGADGPAGTAAAGGRPARTARSGPHRSPAAGADRGGAARRAPETMLAEPIRWRRSSRVGRTDAGRLVRGVQLPSEGEHFFTWDPIRRTTPNRRWRRYGTDRLVRVLLRVVGEFQGGPSGRAARGGRRPHRARGAATSARASGSPATRHTRTVSMSTSTTRAATGVSAERPTWRRSTARSPRISSTASCAPARDSRSWAPSSACAVTARIVQAIPNHNDHVHVRLLPAARRLRLSPRSE